MMFGMKSRKAKKEKIADQLRQKDIMEYVVWVSTPYSSMGYRASYKVEDMVVVFEEYLANTRYNYMKTWERDIAGIPYKLENEKLKSEIEDLENLMDEKMHDMATRMISEGNIIGFGLNYIRAI